MIGLAGRWLRAICLCLMVWPADASGQGSDWDSYSKAGVEAFAAGDFEEAKRQFAAALREARRLGSDNQFIAQSLNGLAEVYRVEDRYAEAERLHREALAIRERILDPDHPALAQSLSNLTRVLRAQAKFDEAEELDQRARAVEERAHARERSWREAMEAANVAYGNGELSVAEKLLLLAVELAQEFGRRDVRLARSLNNLADVYRVQERYDEAEATQIRALELLEANLGPNDFRVGIAVNNLGLVHFRQGRHDDAAPLFERALDTLEKTMGPTHPAVAETLVNLAEVYRLQGQISAAQALIRRALAIQDGTSGRSGPWQDSMTAADAAFRNGDADAAEKELLAAVARAEGFGPQDPRLARSLNNLAELYVTQGRYDEAVANHRRALAHLESAVGTEHPLVATSLINLANLTQFLGRFHEAEELYKRSQAILENADAPNDAELARSYAGYAVLLRDTRRPEEAAVMLARAEAIRAGLDPRKSPD